MTAAWRSSWAMRWADGGENPQSVSSDYLKAVECNFLMARVFYYRAAGDMGPEPERAAIKSENLTEHGAKSK